MKKKLFEEGWLSPVLMMEIVSAHSSNVQPSSKDKNAPPLWSRKMAAPEKLSRP